MSILKALIWKYIERFSATGISLVLSVILARLLSTNDYGIIALINVFIAFATTLVQSGLNTALIQKSRVDEKDWSTGLYANLFLSVLLYLILYFCAPSIANFYNNQSLSTIVRVLSVTVVLGAYNAIQVAYASKYIMFKQMSICTIISSLLSGGVGVWLAYKNAGVWALVWQQILNFAILCVLMRISIRWKIRLTFSVKRLKSILGFGWKLTASSIIDTAYTEVFSLIIGKRYTPSMLAYYNKGQTYPKMLGQLTCTSIGSVMLPVYSSLQSERDKLKEMVRKAVRMSSFVFFPMILGLAAISDTMVIVLFTEKWKEMIPFMKIFCVAFMFYPVNMAITQAINGIGRSDVFLKLNIIKKIIGLIVLSISTKFGVIAIACGYAFDCVINLIINLYYGKKHLNYHSKEQLKDFMGSMLLSFMMFLSVQLLNFWNINIYLKLLVQFCVGVLVYIMLAKVLRKGEFTEILVLIKNKVNKGKE